MRVEPDADRVDELAAGAEEFAERFIVAAKGERFRPPSRPKRLYRQLFSCAHALAQSEAALRALAPRAAIVATTHSIHSRALVLAAREAGITTVYIPHAPVISDARLVDLPVDYAGLRGPAEIDHYEALGAPGGRLTVVGNPAIGEQRRGAHGPRVREPVLATGADDPEALRATIELAHSVFGERCVLSPHPRTDPDSLRELMPDGWRLWTGRTLDLLQQGPPALVQSSSGVALEGLGLGIPTIELAFPNTEPNYPFLRDPPVLFASDPVSCARLCSAPGSSADGPGVASSWSNGQRSGYRLQARRRQGRRRTCSSKRPARARIPTGQSGMPGRHPRNRIGAGGRPVRPPRAIADRPISLWELLDGLAHRRPGPLDLLDGPLARCPPACLLVIEHSVDGVGQSVGARAKVMGIREADGLAAAAPILGDQQARAAPAERAEMGVDPIAHVQVDLAVQLERAGVATRIDHAVTQPPSEGCGCQALPGRGLGLELRPKPALENAIALRARIAAAKPAEQGSDLAQAPWPAPRRGRERQATDALRGVQRPAHARQVVPGKAARPADLAHTRAADDLQWTGHPAPRSSRSARESPAGPPGSCG